MFEESVILNDLLVQTKYIPRALIIGLLMVIAYLFFNENRSNAKQKIIGLIKQRWIATYIFYLAYILTGTIFARQNTAPYVKIVESFGFRKDDPNWNKEIIENIVLFIPYIWLYLKAFQTATPWKNALKVAFLTSLSIELCQLFFWLGAFQLADMVHNVLGGMIGCGIWYFEEWVKKRAGRR